MSDRTLKQELIAVMIEIRDQALRRDADPEALLHVAEKRLRELRCRLERDRAEAA